MNEAASTAPVIERDRAAALMEPLTDLVIRAGAAILAVNRRAMKIDGKVDGSPVTEADLAADRIIGEGLARLIAEVPVLSEERLHLAKPPYRGSFFLIDPLDGTKEFVAGRNEFTVNLALGRVAEGGADIYPRLAPTCEWDVAAGHAVITAAGGKITDSGGNDLRFGEGRREGFVLPEFIAWGDPAAAG
jgi:3'-phosphoadenosine 5'-phosphosulfate (PAPS) 3'-phosphatase